jgi:hypothetical protein
MDFFFLLQIFSKLLLVSNSENSFSIAGRIIAGQIEMLCEIFEFFLPATSYTFKFKKTDCIVLYFLMIYNL